METPMISVIVPVYNVEQYLERCVRSVMAQTFQDLEILLIDDGSTDTSGALCDRLAGEDTRIRVIHRDNGGLSSARNTGIENAAGSYICFVDSDDFISPEMLRVLYRLVTENQADFSVCGICDCYESREVPHSTGIREFTETGIEALRDTLEGREMTASMCSKLIRADLCKDLRFRVGRTYEDAFITPDLMLRANRVAATTQSLYYYWHRQGSITTKPFSQHNMDVIDAYTYTLEMVRKHCPQIEDTALFRLYWAHFVVLDKILAEEHYRDIPQYGEVVAFLKKNWLAVVRCPYFRKSRRIAGAALKIHVGIYRRLSRINMKRQEVHGG